jgi:hypothetical protein
VLPDPIGAVADALVRVFPYRAIANYVGTLNKVRIRAAGELQGGNGNERERDVRAAWPGKRLLFLYLHGKVERGLGAPLPLFSRELIALIAGDHPTSQSIEIFLGKAVAEIRLFPVIRVDNELGLKSA